MSDLTLEFSASWQDRGAYSQMVVGPYSVIAWDDGEWSGSVHGRFEVDAPEYAGGSLDTAKAAAGAWITNHHTARQHEARSA